METSTESDNETSSIRLSDVSTINNIENRSVTELSEEIDMDHEENVMMGKEEISFRLERDGYVVIPNVLTKSEIEEYKSEFFKWYDNTEGLKSFHDEVSSNGIFKYYEVAHQRFAWLARTNTCITNIFKDIWNTDELVTSFDGCCYYPSDYSDNPRFWIHTDQSGYKVGRHCLQSFVSFTENKERTFVLYRGSHFLHQDYFNITDTYTENDWCVLYPEYLKGIQYRQEVLHVKPGSLVMWDSRLFHQNTCGESSCSEERLIQYLCYLPKNSPKNTEHEQKVRRECFENRFQTSHWPYPMKPIHKQPLWFNEQTDNEIFIDYDSLDVPQIDDLREKIEKLL
jgi:ectoine hydroxylase-related dioxygenase (phytanoyl-CoA dioxygenase family)|uniref:Phytanoyl-CoA dioxygenase n=1 Tax=viral metagenome TaxID=1070528 RepID=A0A6C0IKV2_9ZZZZ